MNCPYCNTILPIDNNKPAVICPKCGSKFTHAITYDHKERATRFLYEQYEGQDYAVNYEDPKENKPNEN